MEVMKIRLLAILIPLTCIFFACSEKDIETFHGRHQIYFDKFYMNALYPGTEEADTTRTSFFFYPENTSSIKVQLVVNLSGRLLDADLNFGLKLVEEGTTALPGEYKLEESYVFHRKPVEEGAKEIKDTIELTLIHSDRLAELGLEGVRLVVELVPSVEVDLGQYERRRAVIVWSEVEAQPEWWDYEVQWSLLGDYSYAKYKLFLQTVDTDGELNGELIKENPARAIELVTEFKEWLLDHLDDPDRGDEYREILSTLKV